MNNALFNNIEFKRNVENIIKNTFDTAEWYKMFGDRKIKCFSSIVFKSSQFPNFYVSVTSTPALIHQHSMQINQFSRVILDINTFNVNVGNIDKETLGENIAYEIIKTLQEKLAIPCVNNTTLFNPDEQVYRKLLRFIFIYDNIKKVFYRGE